MHLFIIVVSSGCLNLQIKHSLYLRVRKERQAPAEEWFHKEGCFQKQQFPLYMSIPSLVETDASFEEARFSFFSFFSLFSFLLSPSVLASDAICHFRNVVAAASAGVKLSMDLPCSGCLPPLFTQATCTFRSWTFRSTMERFLARWFSVPQCCTPSRGVVAFPLHVDTASQISSHTAHLASWAAFLLSSTKLDITDTSTCEKRLLSFMPTAAQGVKSVPRGRNRGQPVTAPAGCRGSLGFVL